MERLMGQRNDISANKETAGNKQSNFNNLAVEALNLSARGDPSKKSYDQAIADVQNPNLYTDHPIGDVRGGVVKALQAMQKAEMGIAKSKQDQETLDYLLGKPPADGGRGGTPAPPRPAQTTQAPKTATPKPAPKPVTPSTSTTAPPKPFPRARLAAFAEANHMTTTEAEAALKQQKYTIQ
jgi:hypothetical protein